MDSSLPIMDEKELRTLNQPKRLGPEENPDRPVKCKVIGVNDTYSWMWNGAPVVNGQLIMLPWYLARDYARVGKVQLL